MRKKVKKPKEYAKNIIETVREPLILLDSHLRVVLANNSFYKLFEVSRKETIGEKIYDLGNKQLDIPKLRNLLEDILPKKKNFKDFEVTHKFETVGEKIMLLNAQELEKKERKERLILLAIEDITERKKSQEKIIILKKLATIGELAGIMSHELREPLGIIRNSAYFIKKKLKKSSNETVKEQLNIIDVEIESANQLITNIYDFSKIKPTNFKKEQINNIIKEVISKSAIPANVKVHMVLEENIPKTDIAKEQIRHVFRNIISNAIEAMPRGGKLTITTKKVNAFIQVAFKDTGIGIEKENLSKIFEPLVSFKLRGVGLGLSACRIIVGNHKGIIKAESTKGMGATFTVIFPIKDIYKKTKKTDSLRRMRYGKKNVNN